MTAKEHGSLVSCSNDGFREDTKIVFFFFILLIVMYELEEKCRLMLLKMMDTEW